MRPFHRTLRTLWTAAGILMGSAVVLWGAAFLGIVLVPDDDGLGTAFLGIYLILLGMVPLGASLVVVAHMPGVLDAVLRLASRDSEQDAMMDAASGFPTAGTAVLEVAGDWALLDGADARLTAFYAPRV